MRAEAFARSRIGKVVTRVVAAAMESRLRYRLFDPVTTLRGVDSLVGRDVLEIGCGTGFFTVPAAALIGDHGSLVAMDVLPESVEFVANRVRAAGLRNVRVVQGDALGTDFGPGSFDTVLVFGVIPSPLVPVTRLLIEAHRVLKPGGTLAVWPPVPGWLGYAVRNTGLFTATRRRNGVRNFRRS